MTLQDIIPTREVSEMTGLYSHASNGMVAYRAYYINDKAGIATWKKRNVPKWYVLP
jgi:hypothetical protein